MLTEFFWMSAFSGFAVALNDSLFNKKSWWPTALGILLLFSAQIYNQYERSQIRQAGATAKANGVEITQNPISRYDWNRDQWYEGYVNGR